MNIIGLTGGIATGKSTVADMLVKFGAMIIDADLLSREAVVPGSKSLLEMVEVFGSGILFPDGHLDRSMVRKLVFSDPDKRVMLESILHPAIRALALSKIQKSREDGFKTVVYMSPLLIEAGAFDLVDEIWVVTVKPEIQLERIIMRDSCDKEQAGQIIAAQMPLSEKEQYGKIVIDNSGSIHETRLQVEAAWDQRNR